MIVYRISTTDKNSIINLLIIILRMMMLLKQQYIVRHREMFTHGMMCLLISESNCGEQHNLMNNIYSQLTHWL